MPRGMVLLAALLLLILIGIAGVAGLLRPNEPDPTRELAVFTGGNPERGRETIRQNGCPTCHIITGIKEARGQVGPPLDHFAKRVYIAVSAEHARQPPGLDQRPTRNRSPDGDAGERAGRSRRP
jgi:hypothetical protein